MAASADDHKLRGNVFFMQQLYDDAIREYGIAIVRNPSVPAYYTNRALCFIRMGQHDRAIADAEKAIDLDSTLAKGHYLMGQALLLDNNRLDAAINALRKAHSLAIEQQVLSVEEIGQKLREAKKKKWEIMDARRRKNDSELHQYLTALVERDRQRQTSQLHPDNLQDIEDTNAQFDNRLSEITGLFTRADDLGKRREIPDHFIGKISFELMSDPVVTPSGITYDRSEIISHLRKIGRFDPLSRQPMTESDLIPNLALRDTIADFLAANGWAIDY
ncbi:STIP1 homology and U box-containing protein 1-like protein [Powellomyces hirtus]|nr:STIP1 homology and U box-containing protein 1-like protein [Powellomyces hirtus]